MKAFVIDVGICNGCYACQIACKDEHVGNDWTPYAKPQPDTGQFWMRLTEHIRGTVPKVKMHYIPILCQHCREAPCIKSCPINAIYRRDDGIVIIDPQKCTGCKSCVDSCPYDAIFFNEDLNIAQKCTGCTHLLDSGEWKVPRCVDVCPTEAIKFGEEEELKDLIAKAEVLKPERGCKPRVYYLRIPKKFIAGTVYDPVEKEVVIGAKCTLTDSKGRSRTATTDGFGDFWFEGLEVGTYNLKIEAKGFATKTFEKLNTEKDINLGDIPLSR
ncbi:MAG: 4Fe-4S dicluster domain-containing protein [Dehalococcoidales bacterium]|nr:4Fe-4S dicluster domain-containing protein [Dehalococcoidales bacterium]